jgi:long-chain acyl-CoA synthetase
MTTLQQMCAAALAREASLPAVEYEQRWYDWGQMRLVAERLGAALARSGAAAGAPVIFVARGRPSALAALMALLAQGRSIRMIYPFQSPAGIARDIARLKSAVLIAAEQEFSPEVREALRQHGIAGIVIEDMDAYALPGFDTATASSEAPSEPRIEILTSGTTGPPKQFPITHAMIAKHLVGAATDTDFAAAPPAILYFPLGNISGIYSTVPPLVRGQRAVLLDRFSLEKWRDYVRRYRPTATGIPPAAMHALLEANVPAEEFSSIKTMGLGAAPLDPTLQRAFEQRYNIPILLSYGATEFGGPVAAMTADLHAQWGKAKFGSVGRAMAGARLRIVDAVTHEVLPPGQEGLLEVVSPRIGPDWIRTADIAVLDEDGFLFHRGRADGAIMRGGFKLLPETIERALLLHPAISAAGVVGVADVRLGEVPGAAIEIKAGVDQPSIAELEAHLRQHVLATHIPVHWRFVEALPKTPSFKIDRPAMKQLFAPPS